MSRISRWILLATLAASPIARGGEAAVSPEGRMKQFRSALQWHDVPRCAELIAEAAEEGPASSEAPQMELELGRSLASVQSGLVGRTQAVERLSVFLPGAKYSEAPEAEEGRYWLARAQVLRGRLPQARELLAGLLSSKSPKIVHLASKDLICLGSLLDDPSLAGDCRAALAAVGREPSVEEKEGSIHCAELLRTLDLAARPDSREGALAAALLAQDAVLLCADAGRVDETQSRWADLDISLAKALEQSPPSDSELTSATVLLESRARFTQAMARYRAGDYARCRAISQDLVESCRLSKDPRMTSLGANVGLWLIACDIVAGREPKEVATRLQEQLAQGGCGPGEISWIVRQMADQAQIRGEPEERYLLLRDLVEALPSDPDKTVVAAREAREIEKKQPGLIVDARDKRSSVYRFLGELGRVGSARSGGLSKEMSQPTPQ